MPNPRTNKYPPNSVVRVSPAELFAVTYVDGNSRPDTRLVVKIGDNIHFLHVEGVDSRLKQPGKFIKDGIMAALPDMESRETGDIPADPVNDLPMDAAV